MAIQDDVVKFESQKYEQESWYTRPVVENFYQTVKSLIPKESSKILEIGCGLGFSTERLKMRNYEASDFESRAVEIAQKRNPDVVVRQESVYSLERGDSSVDLIICLEVFEHLENPEVALREIHRVTAKHAILSVPNEPLWRTLNMMRGKYITELGNSPGHINHWSSGAFYNFGQSVFRTARIKRPIPFTLLLLEK